MRACRKSVTSPGGGVASTRLHDKWEDAGNAVLQHFTRKRSIRRVFPSHLGYEARVITITDEVQ